MTDIELLILGVALGAIPTAQLGQLMLAALGKRLGISPREMRAYEEE